MATPVGWNFNVCETIKYVFFKEWFQWWFSINAHYSRLRYSGGRMHTLKISALGRTRCDSICTINLSDKYGIYSFYKDYIKLYSNNDFIVPTQRMHGCRHHSRSF